MNRNLLQLREAILAVAEAHADLAVAELDDNEYRRDYAHIALNDAKLQLDEALEFLGGE